jgi:hypothetical protein
MLYLAEASWYMYNVRFLLYDIFHTALVLRINEGKDRGRGGEE